MKQKIISGGWFSFNVGNNSFTSIHGGRAWTALTPSFNSFSLMSVAGILKKFRVRVLRSDGTPFAPAVGESYTLTVRKNEIDTDLQVIVDETSYNANDIANEIAIAAGNRIDIKCEPGGGPITVRYPLWSFEFEPTNAKESVYFVSGGLWYKSQATGYFTLTPDASNPFDKTEAEAQQVIPTPGKIKSLYLELSNNPGSSSDAYKMTLMKNGSPTALTVSITGASTSGSDLSNEVSVAAGDLVCWKKEALNTPANNLSARAGFAFEADTDGESLFINGSKSAMDTTNTRYRPLSHNLRAWDTDEYKQYQYTPSLIVSRLYVRVSAAPGTDKSWTFRLRKNGVNTALVVTITGDATSGNDTTHSVGTADDDYLDLVAEPTGTPAAAAAYWGAMQTAPTASAVTTQAVTDIVTTTATGNGNVTALGDPVATQHGHCWNTTGTPTTSDSKTENGVPGATGAFTSALTGLTVGTKYYVRAYATNSVGTVYGNQVEFTADRGTVSPTDPLLRVSGIRRTFWSGLGGRAVYQQEIALGGMSITYVSPIGDRDIPSAVTPLTTAAKTITPSGEGYRLRDYGVWLSGTTVDIQTRLFGHSPPTFTEWVDWMEAVSKQGYAEWSY